MVTTLDAHQGRVPEQEGGEMEVEIRQGGGGQVWVAFIRPEKHGDMEGERWFGDR
jgi:hypothetical protein